jgi:hypothetical protein
MSLPPKPWKYGVREDGSIWFSMGDPKNGPHRQFDLGEDEEFAKVVCQIPDLLDRLMTVQQELLEAREQIQGQKQRISDLKGLYEGTLQDLEPVEQKLKLADKALEHIAHGGEKARYVAALNLSLIREGTLPAPAIDCNKDETVAGAKLGVIERAYDFTLDRHGEVLGLTAGDHGFEGTGIKISLEHIRATALAQNEEDPHQQQVQKLSAFVREGLEISWEGGDWCGADIQDKAEELGLIRKEPYDPEKHGEAPFDPGDEYFIINQDLVPAIDCKAE